MEETNKPYHEYKKGDLVWAARPNTRSQGLFSGLDTLRIYEIESFEPPVPPDQHGTVTLKKRPGYVLAQDINPATEENFKHFGTIDAIEKDFFLRYLRWLKDGDKFSEG